MLVVAGALSLAGALPALADPGWGNVDCSQHPHPGCELDAGKGREGGRKAPRLEGRGAAPRPRGGEGGGGGNGSRERDPNLARCAYERSDYEPPGPVVNAAYQEPAVSGAQLVAAAAPERVAEPGSAAQVADPRPGEEGAWYVYKCSSSGFRDAFYRPPVWIPDGFQDDAGGSPTPSPEQVAQRARGQLRLPPPAIRTNPPVEQLVGLPTWLWLARGAWRQVSASASVPGASVTAVARPSKVVWRLGDSSSLTCEGPGTPYDTRTRGKRGAVGARSASPDCGHTYRSSSAGQPGNAYAVSATVHWTVSWSGEGQSGAFPGLTTTADARFRVAESQALNTED
ncbi:ATP/GTP-binding protein [Streptomyces longispororuber]|uniref:ATP/GTP-binding protein n=1 Tax=Streptomyces longispororuber TaxID=68230 RepID=A0A918ZBI7_9ACTN|nr:ATP/GTP-binding protein [Streptomyces longispororuber]